MVEKWNSERFKDIVLRSGSFAAVEFYNDGLPVRQDFGSCLDTVAKRFGEKIKFGKVNVKNEEALAEKYAVRSVPTLMVFCQGREIGEHVGEADTAELFHTICLAEQRVRRDNF